MFGKALALLALACGPDFSKVPDAGTPCSCAHAGAYWYESDDFSEAVQVLAVCTDHTPPSSCGSTKGDAGCDGLTVLLGENVCTWEPP